MDLVGRILEVIGWLAVAVIGGVLVSQVIGWNGTRVVATLQALTPLLALLLIPIAGLALWQSRHAIASVAAILGLGAMVLMAPLIFEPAQDQPIEGSVGLRVALVNLLYENAETDAVASDLARRNLDVIVFNEYTAEHQEILLASPLANGYPFKIDHAEPFAGGIAVWSRHDMTVGDPPKTFDKSLDLITDTTQGAVRIIAVHPRTPVYDFEDWRDDLRIIGQVDLEAGTPTVLVGDFNASYWHPGFRDLLSSGYVDAHIATGRGFSTSWPNDSLIPPFVRLDHALTFGALVATEVEDFDIAGSDHRGFVVTVAPTR